jgi:hypothetical protein
VRLANDVSRIVYKNIFGSVIYTSAGDSFMQGSRKGNSHGEDGGDIWERFVDVDLYTRQPSLDWVAAAKLI